MNEGLVPCNLCGRRFNIDRVDRHQSVCQGPDKKVEKMPGRTQSTPSRDVKWRKQHDDFQQILKAGKNGTAAVQTDPNPDYIPW